MMTWIKNVFTFPKIMSLEKQTATFWVDNKTKKNVKTAFIYMQKQTIIFFMHKGVHELYVYGFVFQTLSGFLSSPFMMHFHCCCCNKPISHSSRLSYLTVCHLGKYTSSGPGPEVPAGCLATSQC